MSDHQHPAKPVQLTLVDSTIYILSTIAPSSDTVLAFTLRRINARTGNEVSHTLLNTSRPVDTLSYASAFAVLENAVVISREAKYFYSPNATNVVQVFGLNGQFRREFRKPYGFDDDATAWPAARAVVVDGKRQLFVRSDGDTFSLRQGNVYHPEPDVLMWLVNGNRAVFPTAYHDSLPMSLLVVERDLGAFFIWTRPLPPGLNAHVIFDFTAWGPDSFAVTLSARDGFPQGVHVFSMNGVYGRELPGQASLGHHFLDGPKHAFLREHPLAPKQRRLLYRHFWMDDLLGVVDYITEDTLALPQPLSATDPDLFDDLSSFVIVGRDSIVSLETAVIGMARWVVFDNQGDTLPVPAAIATPQVRITGSQLVTLGDGAAYVVFDPYQGLR